MREESIERRKSDHFKKDDSKRKKWIEKKGIYYISINFESSLIEVPKNTWWLDFEATTRFLLIQTIRTEKFLYIGNIMKARIEEIETYKLILDARCHIDLERCLYIGDNVFSLFKDMYYYGFGTLIDSLYCFNLDAKFMESLFNVECVVGRKHYVTS
ncbi:hypothetical protein CR513_49602, partial [Mucuna pruriens]